MQYRDVYPWLIHTTAITDKLVETAGEASLRVIRQGFQEATTWDQQNNHDETLLRVWCRDIEMSAHGRPCWYARTSIPEPTYQACQVFFEPLQSQSLKQLLFNNPDVERRSLVHYRIEERAVEYQWIPDDIKPKVYEPLWARLSHWCLYQHFSFHLLEIFLPDVARYTA